MKKIAYDFNKVGVFAQALSSLNATPSHVSLCYLKPVGISEALTIMSDESSANSIIRAYLYLGNKLWMLGKAPELSTKTASLVLEELLSDETIRVYSPRNIQITALFDNRQRF